MPNRTAIPLSWAHSANPMIPANGPYVWPNDALAFRYRVRSTESTIHSTVAMIPPAASHDTAGWRRFGAALNSNAIPTTRTSAPPTRRTPTQIAPGSSIRAAVNAPPNEMATNARVRNMPTLRVSAVATG